jgi:hypothetical protein
MEIKLLFKRWIKNGENKRCPIGNESIKIDQFKSGPRIIKNLLSELQFCLKLFI